MKESSTIASYEDLKKDKTVGVKNRTASQTSPTENQSKYGYKIKPLRMAHQCMTSLNTGSIDAVMNDEPVLKYSISRGKRTPIAGANR